MCTFIICVISLLLPSVSGAMDAALTSLVQQLGHKSFVVREAAARDLLKAGNRAVPALTIGMKHKDAEVAERCRQLLPMAVEADRKKLLAQLLNEPSAPPPKGLPGVSRFLAITGDDKAASKKGSGPVAGTAQGVLRTTGPDPYLDAPLTARQLYAEMMAVHYSIVEAQETKPTANNKRFREFVEQALERAENAEASGRDPYAEYLATRSDVAMFFFVRGNEWFDDTTIAGWQSLVLLKASRMKSDVAGPDSSPAMKKLFLHWLATEKHENEMSTAYEIAKEAKMIEAVPLALKAINNNKKSASYRATLMMDFLTVMGGKEHVKSLAPLLSDHSDMGSLRVGDGPTLEPQVRDIALAVSIRLTGQKPSDFGFHKSGFEDPDYHKYFGGYGFIDDDARKAAHAKWRKWLNGKDQR